MVFRDIPNHEKTYYIRIYTRSRLPAKRVIFVALPLLLAPLVYGTVYSSTSEFEACAAPKDSPPDANCINYKKGGWTHQNCCWEEDDIMNPGKK